MSSVKHLREFIRERLTAAAEEIFTEVEKIIVRYDEDIKLMETYWKPQIKLTRIGQIRLVHETVINLIILMMSSFAPTDLQSPHVAIEDKTSAIQQVCVHGMRSNHDQEEAELQWTEEEQMEPEPPLIKQEQDTELSLIEDNWKIEPEGTSEEKPEHPFIYEGKEEPDYSLLKHEQQEPEHLPISQDQKDLCSSQEGEQLVQKQIVSLCHTATKKRSLKCDVCGKCFEKQHNFKTHCRTHISERSFSCETCSKCFSHIGNLNVHKRVHTGEKPFSCQVHMRIHTGEKPFSCQVCGKKFTQISSLNTHKKVHTVTMSSVQHLREFIREKLTAAAQEIFTEVEKTIICYEEELDAQRRMMGINWKPEIKLHRIGSELQRQSSDLQKPHVSKEEETFSIQQVYHQGRKISYDEEEVGHQWTEKLQMEPGTPLKEQKKELEPPLINKEKDQTDTFALISEKAELEHLPCRHNQKDLHSSQEGEPLVQKQIFALTETSTLQAGGLSEEEPRAEQRSLHIAPVVESKDQEESTYTVSKSQSHTDAKKSSFKCDICGRSLKNQCNLVKHYGTHKGERLFPCETCGKSFSKKATLNVHMRIHTVTMSSVQHLREFIRERLTAAAQEIFTEVEKTIVCYEEEVDAQ
ncbi:hypothetical protein CCH79_00018108 [Gambusia affinis]|uniref:C2H2-type domain-containing protein n=1 Tax=Gambusia affinis TaxID=33528 RepID=A0A315UP52_GAMAF|nr:hypothetical protein CCH79_00018108 [Gambusia affinis]